MVQNKPTSHMNHSSLGEKRMRGSQEEHCSGRSPSSWKQEAREKWVPSSYLLTPQGWHKSPSRAKREFEIIAAISLGKSLLL